MLPQNPAGHYNKALATKKSGQKFSPGAEFLLNVLVKTRICFLT